MPKSGSELERFFDLSLDLLVIAGLDGYMKRVHPDDVASVGEVLGGLAAGKDVIGFENRVVCADGSVRWLQWNTTAMLEQGIVYGVGRDVTDRRRTDAERRVLADEQAALRRVATLVADEASQEEVLAAIAAEIGPLIGIEETRLVRFVDDRSAVTVASAGSSEEFPVGELLPADAGSGTPLARVLATGESVSFDPYTPGDGPVAATLRRMGIRSGVCAPIYVEGRLWGSINTGSSQEDLPPDAEFRLAQFTDLLETAIANTESRAEVERLAEEQAALRRVATLVAEDPESEDLLSAIASEVAHVLDVRGVIVERFEADGSQVIVGRSYDGELAGADDLLGVGVRFPLHPGTLAAEVWETRRGARVEDYSTLQGMMGDAARAVGIGSGCAAPIVVDGRLWGQMCVYSKEGTVLAASTESRLDDFVRLVATAISNYDARASVRRLADEQAALRGVATLVARGAPQTEIFAGIAQGVRGLLGAEKIRMFRYDDDATALVVAASGDTDDYLPVGSRHALGGDNGASRVFRTGRPARIDDYTTADGPIGEDARRSGIRGVVATPILVEGGIWGAMVVLTTGDKPLPAGTESRLGQFTELMATAIANADSRDQLTASRARLVSAGNEARRRVVRDLHDGAQQRLVHTIITLKFAQRSLEDGGEVAPLVVEALEHAEQADEELRELAHGILPAALTGGGLRAGIDAVVARLDLPVHVEVPARRFPAEIEANAYFIVAEALTNVVKHSHAEHAGVRAYAEDEHLHVEVHDDGVGGVDPDGSGIVGLSDRAAALGGRLTVKCPDSGGTLVAVTLPLLGG
jgi:signal transduction histidine kinase